MKSKIKKHIPYITLALMLLFLGYLTLWKDHNPFKSKTGEVNNVQVATGNYDLPVPADNKNVGSVLVHYFFTGKLKELKKTSGGTEIVFADADAGLPVLLVTGETRISKITPPYDQNHPAIDINSLKPGQTIDVSAEFEVKTGMWFVRDVYLPTDRN